MATWNVTDDVCRDATPIGALTTRGQLGALAAGATVARCGSGSAMQRVMGRGHATSFVGLLWSDWVRPTIRRFVLQVSGDGATTGALKCHRATTLWFAASPLLLSVSTGPSRTPPGGARLVDSRRVVDRAMSLETGLSVAVRDVRTGASAVVMQRRGIVVLCFVANASWAVAIYNLQGDSEGHSPLLAVASLRGLPGDGRGGGDMEEALGGAVVVGLPSCPGLLRMHSDLSVDGEVVLVHVVGCCATIFAVDVEQTYNSRSLDVLSTTTCAFPTGHSLVSLVVMKNWDHCSPGYGSRTFIAKTQRRARNRRVHEVFHVEESTGTSRPLDFHDDEVNEEGSFKLFHRDNVEQPLELLPRTKFKFWNNTKMSHNVTAASGFIFKCFASRIEVMEPVSGLIILTINFPRLTSLTLLTPFSFFV
ncbi:hypothetical protein Pelo_18823 [Pelomyxa schiedti]|nr:hypothetical protein Pelo_18823 [Pelomyxa schiedti]